MEQRAVIKFCFKLGKSASETYKLLQKAYGSDSLSRSTTFERFKRFREGRESLEDDETMQKRANNRESAPARHAISSSHYTANVKCGARR
jgi:GH24 family phage-related lysozyme (muramidase)